MAGCLGSYAMSESGAPVYSVPEWCGVRCGLHEHQDTMAGYLLLVMHWPLYGADSPCMQNSYTICFRWFPMQLIRVFFVVLFLLSVAAPARCRQLCRRPRGTLPPTWASWCATRSIRVAAPTCGRRARSRRRSWTSCTSGWPEPKRSGVDETQHPAASQRLCLEVTERAEFERLNDLTGAHIETESVCVCVRIKVKGPIFLNAARRSYAN